MNSKPENQPINLAGLADPNSFGLSDLRHAALSHLPGLPNSLRNRLIDLKTQFGSDAMVVTRALGMGELIAGASSETPDFFGALWGIHMGDNFQGWRFAPSYRHKDGIMPLSDALIAGGEYRRQFWNDTGKLQFHPYMGSNAQGASVWGAEAHFDLLHEETGKPRFQFSVRYDGGARDLTGDKRGVEANAAYQMSEHLAFNFGTTNREDARQDTYALMRWRMTLGE